VCGLVIMLGAGKFSARCFGQELKLSYVPF